MLSVCVIRGGRCEDDDVVLREGDEEVDAVDVDSASGSSADD